MSYLRPTQPVTSDSAGTVTQQPTIPQRIYRIPPTYQQTQAHKPRRRPRLLTILFSLVMLIALAHFIAVLHMPPQATTPVTCTTLLRTSDYTKYVAFRPQQQTIGAIQFINQLVGQPAVLVPVTSNSTPPTLDVYVYGCTTQQHTPALTLLFKQQGLVGGSVSVTSAQTLLLGSMDTSLSAQDMVMQPAQQSNIYHEYRWQQGSFVQIPFPGLYPVLSRGEAEILQQQANSGQQLPWSDPLVTAQQMARELLQRSATDAGDMVLDNDGTTAHVRLVQRYPALTLTVTLTRLIQHNTSGLWFVTNVQTPGLTLQQNTLTPKITSPLALQGTTTLLGGKATVTLFDHTLSPIQTLAPPTFRIAADGNYTGSIVYNTNQTDQPGLLLIEITPPAGSPASAQVLLQNIIIG